ncbi:DUF3142 domain-containing protein [Reinekea sp. G2M2-21]|uniref:DUF3142 domain-containing protein n=1 Tax=Reinekea sp. G2M2-21 TaxID=2788942 RepID=UPI0018A97962|nr:DUF3142 domain-containing protein [Reinekea sp. G2M2-21]
MVLPLSISIGGFFFLLQTFSPSSSLEYWIWRNNDMRFVPNESRLYVYQGNISKDWFYEPLGIKPIGISQKNIAVVLRLYTLVDVQQLTELFESLVNDWARFGITVNELQIDYDSASNKLSEYAIWLGTLNPLINVELSVTGLSTYLWDNQAGLREIGQNVSYIAMQLYQGRIPHDNYEEVIDKMNNLGLRHKIGITSDKGFNNVSRLCKRHCIATIVFMNFKD